MATHNNNQSNFSFLTQHWGFLVNDAQQAEGYTLRDPRVAAIYARRTLELSLKWLFANDTALKAPYETSLAALVTTRAFANSIYGHGGPTAYWLVWRAH
jgi:type I restriction enzyme, R subunit